MRRTYTRVGTPSAIQYRPATARTYYVANAGNDSNDGMSSGSPWRTLSKVSGATLYPGDTILYKKGDTWTEPLTSSFNGDAVNGLWITQDAYGSGALPLFDGGGTIDVGIKFDNVTFTGGWMIKNLKIQNYRIAGIDAEINYAGFSYGLWVEGVTISGITGGGVITNGGPIPNPGYNVSMPTGLMAWRCYGVTLKNSTITGCDTPLEYAVANGVLIDGCLFANASHQGITIAAAYGGTPYIGPDLGIVQTRNIVIKNSRVTNMGTSGFWAGTTGIQLIGTVTTLIDTVEVDNTRRPGSPDGIAIDFEAGQWYTTINNCNVHDNDGCAFLMNENMALSPVHSNIGTVITNNVFNNNGLGNPTNLPALTRRVGTAFDLVQWRGNSVIPATGQGSLFGGSTGTEHAQPLSNTLRSGDVSDGSNTASGGVMPATW